MLSRTHISAFVGLTGVVWLIALWATGQPVSCVKFVKTFGIVVGAMAVVAIVFNRWGWALPMFRGWFVNQPDLRGTWRVLLKSDWIDPVTNQGIDPIVGYIVIRQTLMHLSVRQMTKESRSHSISCGITKESDEIYRLSVVYRNEPDISLQGKQSDIHHGAFWLEAFGKGPDRLKGHYWTDRKTRGGMELTDRVKSLHESYQCAHRQFASGDSDDPSGKADSDAKSD